MRTFLSRTRTTLTGAVLAGGLLLTACGGGGDDKGGGSFNDADVTFAQQMIPHHQQAVEMAALAEGRAADPEVKRIAGAVKGAQEPEVATLRSWLKAWGKPESAPGSGHGDHAGSTDGMMTADDMERLKASKGKDFDLSFAELMVAHHNGAIEMAKAERKDGADSAAKKLAGEVIEAQSAEITELKKILARP
ncbi:DUF305 domain-containing protein [Streptomyces sp. NPDC001941]|uniref:DUF305 domain-containing protein n=1 Tax=Streptomyces sp. NPDC001941 TaxID=3154659 RepID=UPI00332BE2FE